MIITVASFKGGVGKTTTAVHLAAFLQAKSPTLLIDGDPNRSCIDWAKAGGFPFQVVDERQAARYARDFKHIVIDTKARPDEDDLKALADGCDLLIIPTTPDALALKALLKMLAVLQSIGAQAYRVLLTMIPPPPSHDGEDARAMMRDSKLPVFKTNIRRYAAYKKAALAGVLVSEVKNTHAQDAWNDYLNIGKELMR